MTFGYDARAFIRPFEKSTTGRTFTFAEALLFDLSNARIEKQASTTIITASIVNILTCETHEAGKISTSSFRRPFSRWQCHQKRMSLHLKAIDNEKILMDII
jgi:hypothetical protein